MKYLLKKRGLWYRPEAKGYTGSILDAGRFSEMSDMDKFEIINRELYHAGGVDWTPSVAPRVGDKISVTWRRPAWRIWLDRIRLLQWGVPTTEPKLFLCLGTTPGAIWPEAEPDETNKMSGGPA